MEMTKTDSIKDVVQNAFKEFFEEDLGASEVIDAIRSIGTIVGGQYRYNEGHPKLSLQILPNDSASANTYPIKGVYSLGDRQYRLLRNTLLPQLRLVTQDRFQISDNVHGVPQGTKHYRKALG